MCLLITVYHMLHLMLYAAISCTYTEAISADVQYDTAHSEPLE